MAMIKCSYTVRFLTPAFLGDAEQNGAWRTPPFKALLRQWWRVAVAKSFEYDCARIREAEGRLFGNAWLEATEDEKARGIKSHHSKSLVRLRLSQWTSGTQKGVTPESDSPEMKYVAWGLIGRGAGSPDRTALMDAVTKSTEGSATLSLAFPEASRPAIETALSLMQHFGALGSRSRNGWGSFTLEPPHDSGAINSIHELAMTVALPLDQCLNRPWPASLAMDDGLLVWESETEFTTWGKVMLAVSHTKKEMRKRLTLNRGSLSERHVLGLPVKDSDPVGDKDTRMPSPIRFKVFCRGKNLAYRVVAMPHGLPDAEGLDSTKHKPNKPRAGIQRKDFHNVASKAWLVIIESLDTAISGVRRIAKN